MVGTPPLCWASHLIYTYSCPLPKQARYDHPHFPGKKTEIQESSLPQSATVFQIPSKMWGYTLPRVGSTTWRGEHPTESASWVVPSIPHPQTQVSVLRSQGTSEAPKVLSQCS